METEGFAIYDAMMQLKNEVSLWVLATYLTCMFRMCDFAYYMHIFEHFR